MNMEQNSTLRLDSNSQASQLLIYVHNKQIVYHRNLTMWNPHLNEHKIQRFKNLYSGINDPLDIAMMTRFLLVKNTE